jgi:hypothetical protein
MGGDLMNKLKKILACMIITLGILYLPEIHANASTVTIDEATFPDSCVRKFAQEQDVNKDGVLSDEERNIVDYALWDWYTAAAYGVDGSHLIDFTGMQNFPKITKVRLQLGCKVNGKEIYWNYKASNLFQCFPHVKQLSIVSFGTKSIELSGESNTLEALDISFENEILKTGEVVCKMYAPNIKEIDITGNISTKSYSLGKCFPKAKYIYLYDTNVGKSGTLDGFQDIETLFISGKKVTDMNLSFLSGITIHRLEIEKTKISSHKRPSLKTKERIYDRIRTFINPSENDLNKMISENPEFFCEEDFCVFTHEKDGEEYFDYELMYENLIHPEDFDTLLSVLEELQAEKNS